MVDYFLLPLEWREGYFNLTYFSSGHIADTQNYLYQLDVYKAIDEWMKFKAMDSICNRRYSNRKVQPRDF